MLLLKICTKTEPFQRRRHEDEPGGGGGLGTTFSDIGGPIMVGSDAKEPFWNKARNASPRLEILEWPEIHLPD